MTPGGLLTDSSNTEEKSKRGNREESVMRVAGDSVQGQGKNEDRWGKLAGTREINRKTHTLLCQYSMKSTEQDIILRPEILLISDSINCSGSQLNPSIHLQSQSLLSPVITSCCVELSA